MLQIIFNIWHQIKNETVLNKIPGFLKSKKSKKNFFIIKSIYNNIPIK